MGASADPARLRAAGVGEAVTYGDEWMVAWSIEPRPAVEVGPWPDLTGWSRPYECAAPFCEAAVKGLSMDSRADAIRNTALDLLLQGLPAADVHREFSKIQAWHGPIRLLLGVYERATWDGLWSPHNP